MISASAWSSTALAAAPTVLQAQLASPVVQAGQKFSVTFNFNSDAQPADYKVFVHFVDPKGTVQFQNDHQPPTPTSKWKGKISYTRTITAPLNKPNGPYSVVIGLSGTAGRVTMTPGSGVEPLSQRRYGVAKFTFSGAEASDPQPVISAASFGALPDDAKDDTSALNAAIASLSKGGTLLLSPGTYHHADNLVVNTSNVTLKGYGTTLESTSVDRQTVVATGVSNLKIKGLKFVLPSPSRGQSDFHTAILVRSSKNVEIADNHILGSRGAGIFVSAETDGYSIHHNRVENTMADGIHNTNRVKNGVIFENTTVNTGDDGIAVVSYFKNKDVCSGIEIRNNRVLGNYHGRGITVVGGTSVTVRDNYIEKTSSAGILLASEAAYSTYAPKKVTISNNTLVETNHNTAVTHGGIIIIGREGTGESLSGPVGLRTEDVTVQGNTVIDTIVGPAHIRAQGPSHMRLRILNNTIIDADSSKKAVSIGAPAQEFAAIGNTYNDAPVADSGSLGATAAKR